MDFPARRFKLVYSAACLCYAWSARVVVEEIARVCTRPGYVFVLDGGERVHGPTPSARTDHKNAETLRRFFHRHRFRTWVCDDGRSPAIDVYRTHFALASELTDSFDPIGAA